MHSFMVDTAAAEAPKIPRVPSMPAAAVARLKELMAASECYLEYGTGGSTFMASDLGVPMTVCVESDSGWLSTLESHLEGSPGQRILIHADIGPTQAWGHPVDDRKWRDWRLYPLGAWDVCRQRSLSPDLILVDGRFRVACFYASLLNAKAGARILFDDYIDRPKYHRVEALLTFETAHDRTAEFVVPTLLDHHAVWRALVDAINDPG